MISNAQALAQKRTKPIQSSDFDRRDTYLFTILCALHRHQALGQAIYDDVQTKITTILYFEMDLFRLGSIFMMIIITDVLTRIGINLYVSTSSRLKSIR